MTFRHSSSSHCFNARWTLFSGTESVVLIWRYLFLAFWSYWTQLLSDFQKLNLDSTINSLPGMGGVSKIPKTRHSGYSFVLTCFFVFTQRQYKNRWMRNLNLYDWCIVWKKLKNSTNDFADFLQFFFNGASIIQIWIFQTSFETPATPGSHFS